jgi:hypothetical protein
MESSESKSQVILEICILCTILLLLAGFFVVVKLKGDSSYEQATMEISRLEKELDGVDKDMEDVVREEDKIQNVIASIWQEEPMSPSGNIAPILQDIITESQRDMDTLKGLMSQDSYGGENNVQ